MGLRHVTPVVFALGLLAVACVGSSSKNDAGAGPPARNATTAPLLPTKVGALPDFDYARYRELLGQLKGTPVVVNFWASWCGPCRAEAPMLAEAARTYGDRVQFLGVDIRDDRSAARDFIREFSWTYPSVFDEADQIKAQLGFIGQPDTVFYDESGEPVLKWGGPLTPELLRKGMDRALG